LLIGQTPHVPARPTLPAIAANGAVRHAASTVTPPTDANGSLSLGEGEREAGSGPVRAAGGAELAARGVNGGVVEETAGKTGGELEGALSARFDFEEAGECPGLTHFQLQHLPMENIDQVERARALARSLACERERERERQRQRERDRDRDRERQRQSQRQRQRQRQTERERQRQRQTERESQRQRQTERERQRQGERQRQRQTERDRERALWRALSQHIPMLDQVERARALAPSLSKFRWSISARFRVGG